MYTNKDLRTWDKKLDNLLVVVQNEYLICIDSLRHVDEKANKYLTALSIIFAATFTALSSNLTDNVKFTLEKVGWMSLTNLLSIIFAVCLVLGIFYGGKTFLALLASIKLIKTARMPTHRELIEKYPCNDIDFKGVLVESYQKVIDEIKHSTHSKQIHIDKAEQNICSCSLLLMSSLTILVFIKFIEGK